jgi:hypothetical protein
VELVHDVHAGGGGHRVVGLEAGLGVDALFGEVGPLDDRGVDAQDEVLKRWIAATNSLEIGSINADETNGIPDGA